MSDGLRFGMTLTPNCDWDELLRRAKHIESLGFDSLWVNDHLVSWIDGTQPRFDGWSVLAALALQVPRIRIGVLVTHTTFRNPSAIARATITLDHLTGGRFELGIGAGGSSADYRVAGVVDWPNKERMQRFRESVEILDRVLRGDSVEYHGEYSTAVAEFRPFTIQRPRPPITVAALGGVGMRIAAEYADRWSSWAGTNQTLAAGTVLSEDEGFEVAQQRNRRMTELIERAGRDRSDVVRSLLSGWPQLAPGTPWASAGAFEAFVERYVGAGYDEFVFVYPPEEYFAPGLVEESIVERVAAEVIPRMRG